MHEKVGDTMQGGVTMFPFKFISGIMRARFNPIDGQLYVVGMKGWQTDANKAGCLTRVRYTEKPIHMPVAYHITKTGLDITFSDSLDPASAGEVDRWSAVWYNIHYTGPYGSPE